MAHSISRWTVDLARGLERGRWSGPLARVTASAWAPIAARGLVRPGTVPAGIGVVCVGGATLGGSGKTPASIACARELAACGAKVVVVGHAYRSRLRAARVVTLDDALQEVGDEALVCAEALRPSGVPVVVAPTRQSAIDHAVGLFPDVLVFDGPLRLRGAGPRALSLLAVDARRPWGSGRLPPAGDLRAAPDALLACADHVVEVDATPARVRWCGRPAPLAFLRGASFGLFTALARPARLIDALRSAGLRPRVHVATGDHMSIAAEDAARMERASVDAWVATEKCAIHVRNALRRRLGVLEMDLALGLPVHRALVEVCGRMG